jgi:hypothetical protein
MSGGWFSVRLPDDRIARARWVIFHQIDLSSADAGG